MASAIEQSNVPLHEMPAHRPTDGGTGIGLDLGLRGVVQSHVAPIDADFKSLRIFERERNSNAPYMMDAAAEQMEYEAASSPKRKKKAKKKKQKKGKGGAGSYGGQLGATA